METERKVRSRGLSNTVVSVFSASLLRGWALSGDSSVARSTLAYLYRGSCKYVSRSTEYSRTTV